MEIDARTFRDALGQLPTGVIVVTGWSNGYPAGMSCNSFTSVSLDPPLVGFFPANTSSTWPGIRESRQFTVNFLANGHEALARDFSRRGVDRFAGVAWRESVSGPLLEEAMCWIQCEIAEEYPAGDHTVVLGRVRSLDYRDDDRLPLVFHRGNYGTFTSV
ncbi:flavin reductase family protein [Arthrobacter mobilis]|uniref:Flavin reductase family protein n=1 Tax=Arthrobacter mobilis TaxID=2724944 RepID=A0A7X6K6Y3_9MICC|nr:flavin reductase family protein [Arthrobacter mobilis]NKX55913.1 flavin reductase family protein [Arthrobacter mobilis]